MNNSDISNEGRFDFVLPSLTTAAHELKSPLVVIRQLLLAASLEDVSDKDRQQLIQQSILSAERALRLTSDLTRSARLEDAMFQLEPVNPIAMCREVASELKPLFKASDRTITVKSRRHPLLLVANRDLLRRIVMNFTDNALHYSEAGTAVELQVNALQKGKIIRIGVRDYGPALSSDMWRSLQGKLQKAAPQAIHSRPLSSGLGIYIAGLFADSMNGSIGAVRHRDGATFFVDLDASKQLSLV